MVCGRKKQETPPPAVGKYWGELGITYTEEQEAERRREEAKLIDEVETLVRERRQKQETALPTTKSYTEDPKRQRQEDEMIDKVEALVKKRWRRRSKIEYL